MYYKDLSELSKDIRKKRIKSILKHELKNYSKLNALINAKKLIIKNSQLLYIVKVKNVNLLKFIRILD